MSEKILPHHLQRKAVLYIRQSSAYQVQHNAESRKLQSFYVFMQAKFRSKFGPFRLRKGGKAQPRRFEQGIDNVALVSELGEKEFEVVRAFRRNRKEFEAWLGAHGEKA